MKHKETNIQTNFHKDIEIIDGIKFVSVTVVLSIIREKHLEEWRGSVGNDEADRRMRIGGDKGTEGHKYFHMMNEGNALKVLKKKLKPEMKKIVKNYHDWDFKNIAEGVVSEKKLYSKKYQFVGTPDRLVKLINGSIALLDHKTGSVVSKKAKWQACAYKYLLEEDGYKVNDVIILHNCIKTGKFNPIWIPRNKHLQYFHSFLYTKKVYIDWHYN